MFGPRVPTDAHQLDQAPVPNSAALQLARELVSRFYPDCFWFRHPNATIETIEDIRLVIMHLREYGGHEAWREAQRLQKCL